MDGHSPAESHNGLRPPVILKLKGPSPPSNRACRACQVRKVRCEFDHKNPSAPCKRCTRKKLECVVAMSAPKRRKLSHSTDPTKASKQPSTSSNPQNVADSDARDQVQHKYLQSGGPEQSSPAQMTEQQPQATRFGFHAHAPSPPGTSTPPSPKPNSKPHSSNGHPPGMMLFSISQIEKVLDIYDRRKQRIQYLEAQVDDLQQSLNQSTAAADRTGSPDQQQQQQQRSLVAALGGALVHQAKITDLNELYNLLEDLGVDQSHYWALHENEEFRAAFPPAHHGHSRSRMAEEQESAMQRVLDALHPAPVNMRKTPPSQPTESAQSQPKEAPEKQASVLTARADADPAVTDLVKAVASSKASAEELTQFQAHIDEVDDINSRSSESGVGHGHE